MEFIESLCVKVWLLFMLSFRYALLILKATSSSTTMSLSTASRKPGGTVLLNANGYKPLAQAKRANLRAELQSAKLAMKTQKVIDDLIDIVYKRCQIKGFLRGDINLIDVIVNVTFDDILTRVVFRTNNPEDSASEEEVVVTKKKSKKVAPKPKPEPVPESESESEAEEEEESEPEEESESEEEVVVQAPPKKKKSPKAVVEQAPVAVVAKKTKVVAAPTKKTTSKAPVITPADNEEDESEEAIVQQKPAKKSSKKANA